MSEELKHCNLIFETNLVNDVIVTSALKKEVGENVKLAKICETYTVLGGNVHYHDGAVTRDAAGLTALRVAYLEDPEIKEPKND